MTVRCAVINLDTMAVENAIEYEAVPVGVPPGFEGNFIAEADAVAAPGWGWDGTKTFDRNPPAATTVPQQVLSQDLVAQFTTDDAGKIQAAINAPGNTQLWLLWQSLTAQRDPIPVNGARFKAGWSALINVLGQARMDAIAVALRVTVTLP